MPKTDQPSKPRTTSKAPEAQKATVDDVNLTYQELDRQLVDEVPDDDTLAAAIDDPRYRRAEFVEQLMVEIEGLQTTRPQRAKTMAGLALRLASRLPNTTFARAWDLWATTSEQLGSDHQAEGARMIAALFDPNMSRGPAPTKGRKRLTAKAKKKG